MARMVEVVIDSVRVSLTNQQRIVVLAQGQIQLNDETVTVPQLKDKLQQLKTDNPDLGVVVKGADEVDYQVMVSVMDTLRQLDITKMGLATD